MHERTMWDWPQRGDTMSDDSSAESQAGASVIGYNVEAVDGRIGEIDEASYFTSAAYLVVDTGWWIFGKKRLVPAGMVTDIDHSRRVVFVACDKEQIRNAPDYDHELVAQEDRHYHRMVGDYYERL